MKFRSGWILLLALAACSQGDIGTRNGAAKSVAAVPVVRATVPAPGPGRVAASLIADRPDQGALVAYPQGAAVRSDGALAWHPAAISEAHAINAIATGEMVLPTPDGRELRLRYLRHVEQLDGNWTWVGQVVGGDPRQNAVITFGERAVFGSIPQGAQPPLQVQTRQGKVFVVQADPSRLVQPRRADDGRIRPPHPELSPIPALAKTLGRKASAQATAEELQTVDTVIGYTAGLAAELGGASAATTRMVYLVEYARQAMDDSEVDGTLRLVGTVQVDYTDSTSNDGTLDELTEATAPALDPLHDAREQFGADIVLLVRDLTEEHDGCGIAWLLGGGQEEIVPSDANWAFGVVSDGSYTEGNSTWYCSDSTLAHEAGHILGSSHDRANASGDGRYPYSYGYNANGACDVMAYCDDGNVEYQVYSNPRIDICGGKACGVANSEDNARSLGQTIPVIATFRATVVPHEPTRALRNDFNGDGKEDVFWRAASRQSNILWYSADRDTGRTVLPNVNPQYQVAATGDFNGDGRADVLWRLPSTGANILWNSADRGDRHVLPSVSGSWSVAGAGDFDGDGEADLLWRKPSTGENILWWSADRENGRETLPSVDPQYIVAGIGDFDGDGEQDIMWRSPATGANSLWRSADRTNGYQDLVAASTAYAVAGIGDFDADGESDLLWRNASTGANVIWYSADRSTRVELPAVPTDYIVAQVGDFDGDGEADIFWRNGKTGANVLWRSADRANGRETLTSVAIAYQVVSR